MQVDRGGYLVFVTSIALGGVGGYIASERDLVPHLKKPEAAKPEPPPPPAPVVVDAGPPALVSTVVDAGPTCDDTVATDVGECPPIGLPTIEGGCGAFTQTRCNDFKRTMKPKVAAAAVACLNKLNYAERCDAKRVELCAHQALMSACPESVPACDGVVKSCTSASRAECNSTMSGLKELGRETMTACLTKHCADRGILGCAASPP